ncbi:MAG: hypothetical protein KKD55_04370, partial [Candidatus Omnitrophica bacterium]|nr:hypothetical protein [Candidatus Omnitrophota bacterium]
MYIPIWLIVLIALTSFVFYRQTHKEAEFSPISISIEPKWDELFKDYKIANDDSWKSKILDSKDYNVIKNGINFTILKPELIYDDDRHHFQTTIDFRRKIDEVSSDKDGAFFVGIYVKHRVEGYEVGIRTPDSHAKSYKERREYKSFPEDESDLIRGVRGSSGDTYLIIDFA